MGSYALPSWLWIVIERAEEVGDLGESDLRETLDDAVRMALADQERAQLDVVTDGEMRRRDFIQNFYGLMTGSPRRTALVSWTRWHSCGVTRQYPSRSACRDPSPCPYRSS